jgi:hypothetical protein
MKTNDGLKLLADQSNTLMIAANAFEKYKVQFEWGSIKKNEFSDSKNYAEVRKNLLTAINSIEAMKAHLNAGLGHDIKAKKYTADDLPKPTKNFPHSSTAESRAAICTGDINAVIKQLENMGGKKPENLKYRTFVNGDNSKVDLKKGYFTKRTEAYKALKTTTAKLKILSKA